MLSSFKLIKAEDKYFFRFVLSYVIGNLIILFEEAGLLHVPLVKYSVFFFAEYYLICLAVSSWKYVNKQSYLFYFVVFFLCWNFVSFLRSYTIFLSPSDNYIGFKKVLSGDLVLISLPILLLIRFKIFYIKIYVYFAYILALLGILFSPIVGFIYKSKSYFGIEQISRTFTSSGSIILLTANYHKYKKILFVIFSFIVSLLMLMIFARRNMIVYLVLVMLFSVYAQIYWTSLRTFFKEKYFVSFITIQIILVLILVLSYNQFSVVFERFGTGFESRETVIADFIDDFSSDPIDWVIGRGFYGSFNSSDLATNVEEGTRDGIENGYLTHILNGGCIQLVFILGFIFYALYLGFFDSRNLLVKAFASILVIYLVDMIGFGIPQLHLRYLNIWIAFPICLSGELRSYSNSEILHLLRGTYG